MLKNALFYQPVSSASSPSKTSSATPPFSATNLIIFLMTSLFIPPLGGLQTPSSPLSSVTYPGPSAALANFAGLSIVRTASTCVLPSVRVTLTAKTASATASSEAEGSKNMLLPTAMTKSVIGGLDDSVEFVVEDVGSGKEVEVADEG